jgi:hypothetical protein
MKERLFSTEADLVAAFCSCIAPERFRFPDRAPKWVAYHETAGWDLLLAHPDGQQIGIEAKLTLNPKVLSQALPGRWADEAGPDFRAVLVPEDGLQLYVSELARHLGIVVIAVRGRPRAYHSAPVGSAFDFSPDLPDQWNARDWPNWCPAQRCKLPDYVPDVLGGKAAPVQLSEWKIKAIKLLIILERTGSVTRADMKVLGLSPTRWTDHWSGFLSPGPDGGYIRNGRTPDLLTQHPENWRQIEADIARWGGQLRGGQLLNGAAA